MTKPEVLNDVSKEDVAIGLGIVAIVALAVDGARHGVKKIYKFAKKHSGKKHHKSSNVVEEIKEEVQEAAEAVAEAVEQVAEKVEGEVVQDQTKGKKSA